VDERERERKNLARQILSLMSSQPIAYHVRPLIARLLMTLEWSRQLITQ
jgi:hypothetical protein